MHTCNVRPQRHSKSCLAGYSVNKRILQPVFDLRTSINTENKLQYIAHVDIIRSQRNVQNYLYRTQTCMTVCTCTCNLRTLHLSIYDINHHFENKNTAPHNTRTRPRLMSHYHYQNHTFLTNLKMC